MLDYVPVDDDWRVTVELEGETHGRRLKQAMRDLDLPHEAHARVGSHVVVSHDGPHVFLYTDSNEHASALEQMVRPLLTEHDLEAEVAISRWHPVEERWEDAGVELPSSAEDVATEEQRRDDAERAESRAQGHPEWELQIVLPSRQQADEFAQRLEAEGFSVARRWQALLIATETEDDARKLAERLRGEAPEGTQFGLELDEDEVASRVNPYGFLGGIAQ